MKIIKALKTQNARLTVSGSSKWLVWDETIEKWVVYYRAYGKKNVQTLIETSNEEEAVHWLLT